MLAVFPLADLGELLVALEAIADVEGVYDGVGGLWGLLDVAGVAVGGGLVGAYERADIGQICGEDVPSTWRPWCEPRGCGPR